MIFTFYSFKGGVGRSMALANIAELFYEIGLKVLVIDWDLEAPGLESFFSPEEGEERDNILKQPGLMDMLQDYKEQIKKRSSSAGTIDELLPPLERYLQNIAPNPAQGGQLWLLTAGQRTHETFAEYARHVLAFDWLDFYQNWEGERYLEWLRQQFNHKADVVLIDSRTGVTEISGICTYHLADAVIMLCAPSQQNLDGSYAMAQNFKQSEVIRKRSGRPLEILIVPARIEEREEPLKKFQKQFIEKFSNFLPETLKNEIDSFWELQIPHVPYFAFHEILAIRERRRHTQPHHSDRTKGMISAFEKLAKIIIRLDPKLLFINQEVIDFYLSRSTWAQVASIFDDDKLESLYQTGRIKVADNILSQFPFRELERRPRLLLLWGKILTDDLGQVERAMHFFNLAEEEFRKQADPVRVAEVQIWQSVGLRMTGQADKAVALASQGLAELERQAPHDHWLLAWATRNRGIAYGTAGDIAQALQDTYQALTQFEALGNRRLVGLCHHDLGVSLEKQGKAEEAVDHYKRAVEIWKELGHENNLANSLIGLGGALGNAGRYAEALATLNEGLEIALRIGAKRRVAFALAGIGQAYLGQQEYQQAAHAFTQSTTYAQDVNVTSLIVANQVKLSECFYYSYQDHSPADALAMAAQARETAAEYGLRFEESLASILEAQIRIRQGEYAAGFELFSKAAAYFAENKAAKQVAQAKLLWAAGLRQAGKIQEAFDRVREAIKLIPDIREPVRDLRKTIAEVQDLLHHFLSQADIPDEIKEQMRRFITESQDRAAGQSIDPQAVKSEPADQNLSNQEVNPC